MPAVRAQQATTSPRWGISQIGITAYRQPRHRCTFPVAHGASSRLHIKASLQGSTQCGFVVGSPLQRSRGKHGQTPSRRRIVAASSAEGSMLVPLGLDFLTFLSATVLVIPLFKSLKLSPILGFLFSGVVLKQLGLFQDLKDTERLAELGVLFLLFEMGLELSLDRLKALAKFAFGLGTLQVALCTAIFTSFALPVGHGLGTIFLENIAHAPHRLVSIRSVDEAVVIGAALSMSSSAFVLQLLRERGELATKFGNATLGVLLFQDIAVVPFLVLLPLVTQNGSELLEGAASSPVSLLTMLGPTALQTVAGLGALLLADRLIMKRIFEMVAQSRNSETFIALCLLTVAGTSLITQRLGLSDTMGAFLAGVLLSETSYRTQIEADIRPFKGLLLGLFFVTTGSSINITFLTQHWQEVFWILAGLLVIKTSVVSAAGQVVGLTRNESIRTGFVLSQGGEFAFVLLSLANSLRILPTNLNQLLIIVVVLSMALTPALAETGKVVANKLDEVFPPKPKEGQAQLTGGVGAGAGDGQAAAAEEEADMHQIVDPIVICGFSPAGQMVANMLQSPLASVGLGSPSLAYLAFDLDPERVSAGRKAGFKVTFGDATRSAVLRAAGIEAPKAVAVCYADKEQSLQAVYTLRADFPSVPIFACAADLRHAAELEEAGADQVVIRSVEAGLALGSQLLGALGASEIDVSFLKRGIEDSIEARTTALADWLQSSGDVPASASLDMLVLTGETDDIAKEAAAVAAAEIDAQVAAALSAEAAQPGTAISGSPAASVDGGAGPAAAIAEAVATAAAATVAAASGAAAKLSAAATAPLASDLSSLDPTPSAPSPKRAGGSASPTRRSIDQDYDLDEFPSRSAAARRRPPAATAPPPPVAAAAAADGGGAETSAGAAEDSGPVPESRVPASVGVATGGHANGSAAAATVEDRAVPVSLSSRDG